MPERILIVGASGRAAAASAIRAGFEPFVIDLFADADTVRLCPTLKCDPADYPHGFVQLAKQAPPGPWMYTGGLENHPDVIAAISETRPLWGNGPDVLKLVRDPWFLDSLPKHVAGFAEVAACRDDTAPWGWVRKPLAGAGGGGMRSVAHGDRTDDTGVYYQEFIEGEPESAVFVYPGLPPWATDGGPSGTQATETANAAERPSSVAQGGSPGNGEAIPNRPEGAGERGMCSPLGRTLQLIGTPWLHAGRFRYAGNVSRPWDGYPVGGWESGTSRRIDLCGLIGIDFIGQSILEVNPRYTASVEVLEFAHCVPLLTRTTSPPPATRVVGKAIYYAAKAITFPASGPWDDSLARCSDVWRMPDFADIPHAGSVIEPGQPVFTLFVRASTEAECVNQLKAKAAECDRLFGVPTPQSPLG